MRVTKFDEFANRSVPVYGSLACKLEYARYIVFSDEALEREFVVAERYQYSYVPGISRGKAVEPAIENLLTVYTQAPIWCNMILWGSLFAQLSLSSTAMALRPCYCDHTELMPRIVDLMSYIQLEFENKQQSANSYTDSLQLPIAVQLPLELDLCFDSCRGLSRIWPCKPQTSQQRS